MSLTGYKTFILGFAVILLGQLGMHVAPDVIQRYGDVIFSAIGVLIVVLRVFTNTPIFGRLESAAGFSQADAAALKSEILAALPDTGSFSAALTDLMAKLEALTPPAPAASSGNMSAAPISGSSTGPAGSIAGSSTGPAGVISGSSTGPAGSISGSSTGPAGSISGSSNFPAGSVASASSAPPLYAGPPPGAVLGGLIIAACLFLMAGCTQAQLQVAEQLLPPILGVAPTASPAISSDVSKACVAAAPQVATATAATGGAVLATPGTAAAVVTQIDNLVGSSCTLEGQVALTANDNAPVTPGNSGNSAQWLSDLATAARVVASIASVAILL